MLRLRIVTSPWFSSLMHFIPTCLFMTIWLLVGEPKVFLFDEPLSNLDAKLRVETRANISKLHLQLQTTFIYVTHDQVEAMTMASRIAVINKGLLQQMDRPQTLYDFPNNLFVAGFLGSPQKN